MFRGDGHTGHPTALWYVLLQGCQCQDSPGGFNQEGFPRETDISAQFEKLDREQTGKIQHQQMGRARTNTCEWLSACLSMDQLVTVDEEE